MKILPLLSLTVFLGLSISACSKEESAASPGKLSVQPAPYKVVFVSGKEVATSKLFLDGRNIQYLTAGQKIDKPLDETTQRLQHQTYVLRLFDATGKEEIKGRLLFDGSLLEKQMERGDIRIERDELDRIYTVWLDM